ncbi:metal ABC transporter ATP-binding protein [Paenibacillus dendritiformis]|uniref:metal ABC transporter ATP-binding protein n=1 Tax=Paenibacillus dendritiformis TaxID=130049 RepID=UPI00364DB707
MPRTIDVNNLHISYYGKEVIKDVSFSLQTGKLIGILGPNGAGKSTLMKAMLNLIPRDGGEITLGGEPLTSMRKKIAYVPQRSNIDWDFPIIVKDTVLLGTFPTLGLFRRPAKQDKEWALECLRKVGMEKFKNNQIGELSGGQQQRVFLARALAQKAEYFFLDEPFVGIDVASENVIIDILKTLRDEGKTVFVVHHDLSKVESYFDNLILMNKELIGCGPVDHVFRPELMQEAYQTPFTMIGKLGVGM